MAALRRHASTSCVGSGSCGDQTGFTRTAKRQAEERRSAEPARSSWLREDDISALFFARRIVRKFDSRSQHVRRGKMQR